MNPLEIESSVVGIMSSQLPGLNIYAGTGSAELLPESQSVTVSVDSISWAEGSRCTARLSVRINCPSMLGPSGVDQLGSSIEMIDGFLTTGYLVMNWSDFVQFGLYGITVNSISTSQDGNSWVAEVAATLNGVDRRKIA
jgi:hypothetical protein